MDALAQLLYEVRSDGALFSRNLMAPPWSVGFAARTPLTLVTMVRGTGHIHPGGGAAPVAAGPGDVAIVVGTEPFTVADSPDPGTAPLYVVHGPDHCTTADGEAISDDLLLSLRTCGN